MITVTFPTGVRLTYNEANFVIHGGETWKLLTDSEKNGGRIVALFPAATGLVVEFSAPCRIESPIDGVTDERLVADLAEHPARLRQIRSRSVIALKRALTDFDARTGSWK